MPLSVGGRVGSFEIVAPLGAGGMGEVYRARDTKLGRDVAVKSLPSAFLHDPERTARLQREAQLLATLNHPNIAAIYGLEQLGDAQFLVLELVEGETLADRLARGPLPLDDALDIARQIADALENAHERAIIHRDLKPANIALTHDGQVKILDFGLAKAVDPTESQDNSMSPTLSLAATRAGVILGTAAYMSPEQARGRAADKRTDVWAFGCVLFEMLSGKKAFQGEDVTDIIAAVVRAEPDWSALPATVPEHIRVLIRGCLDKDRRSRISDVAVARFVMNEAPSLLAAVPPSQLSATTPLPRRRSLLWSAAGLVVGIGLTAAAVLIFLLTRPQEESVPIRFSITPSPQPLYIQGNDRDIAITPDGRHIIYVVGMASQPPNLLMVRDQANLEAKVVASGLAIRHPFTSPDGRWIGFFTNDGLKKVSIDGGPSITLCPSAAPRGAAWNEDDTIVFASSDITTGLMSVSANGGTPNVISRPDKSQNEFDHLFPSFLPGGSAVLLTVTITNTTNSRVEVLDLKTGQRQPLLPAATQASYVDTGHLVYAANGSLFAIPFDPDTRATTGDAVPIVEQLMMFNTGAAEYAVSRHGSLVYITGTPTMVAEARTLVWANRQGREEPIRVPDRAYTTVRISPDGTRAALDIRDRASDIWIWDFRRQTLTPLTFAPNIDMSPVWTADSQRIVWASITESTPNLSWQASDGTGSAERLTTASNAQFPTSVSRDGKLFLFEGPGGTLQMDISMMSLPSPGAQPSARPSTQTLLDNTKAVELNPEISPDGRWLAYQSNKLGHHEIYVSPFPNVNGGLWQVSPSGGSRPAWSSNGRELFYLDGKGLLTVVPVETSGSAFSPGNPQRLFETAYVLGASSRGFDLRSYDVTADGQRFLMIKESSRPNQPAPSLSLTVALNAGEDLKARVRPKR